MEDTNHYFCKTTKAKNVNFQFYLKTKIKKITVLVHLSNVNFQNTYKIVNRFGVGIDKSTKYMFF